MKQQLQIRLAGISSQEWRDEFLDSVAKNSYAVSIEVPQEKLFEESGSAALVDPMVLCAIISGGATIIANIIKILVEMFLRRHPETPEKKIIVVIHGTANSNSFSFTNENITESTIENKITGIGSITGIDILI